ncbi:putative tam domain methyltransferase protein [Botryosphaeria dothidea]|uniref:Tam domain methyltransferase protein n=1 Tax=Botryosphaeria dothidea TaxID=55169 RepID=A0A8H4N2E6_9PEZI|nr:putative tam domain methyltransferase protein [Botryosphaeria dothidea]
MTTVQPDDPPLAGPGELLEVDNDSSYADSTTSSDLTSLASSVTRGLYENGRRYHSFGSSQYAFPNDDAELDRLDMQHAMMTRLLDNKLFWSPISHPRKVLDLGTGTGIWAMDFAELFPAAEVVGTDLSAIQPSWVPPNCKFEIDDAERDWTWPEDTFDYIHNRNFVCSIRDWPRLIEQCYRHAKPGGYVEFQEKHPWIISDDNTLAPDSPLVRWSEHFFLAGDKFGKPPASPRHLKTWMEAAGFVDVEEHVLKLPIGPWPKEQRLKQVGAFERVNMDEGIEGLTLMLFTRALGWSKDEVEVFLAQIRKEVKRKDVHSYYHFYVVYGKKPEKA